MAELLREKREDKKEILKRLIRSLHEGADPEWIKDKFQEVLEEVTPMGIAEVEEELMKEGMPREEVQRLCDVHLAVFRESLEKEKALPPAGHPIHILMEEHKMLLRFGDELKNLAHNIAVAKGFDSDSEQMKQLRQIAGHFKESQSHYLREENVLFPYLEKHGITQPPAIMWMEHDKIRAMKKNLYRLVDTSQSMVFPEFASQLRETSFSLADMLSSHFYKENNILFPAALDVMEEPEWIGIRSQFDELGYCSFTPLRPKPTVEKVEAPVQREAEEGFITFETGALSKGEIEAILNALPIEITFVDAQDSFRYFSQNKERIFIRTKAAIGRKVQQCHPQKSIHAVNQILDDFRGGRREAAEFWMQSNGRFVHIRFFPVRDRKGKYLGCIEVVQDITEIKKLEGEKRLL